MTDNKLHRFDTTNAIIAFFVWAGVLVVYTLTKAPTLSFWDCGEFITASHVLGIPHPPGSPLYVLFGRLFSLIPFSSDIAVRVNMFSAVSSSFTALFGYLVVVRLLREWFSHSASLSDQQHEGLFTRILIYGGGASGAFFAAFGLTNWNNSVEAEVYGLTMLLMSAILWLCLVYYQNRGTPFADRVMMLIIYLAFLGVGVHMSVFLIIPVAIFFLAIKNQAPNKIQYGIAIFVLFELYLIFAMSSRPGEVPYYVPVMIVAIFYFFYIFSFERIPRYYLLFAFGLLLAALPFFGEVLQTIARNSGNSVSNADSLAIQSKIGMGIFIVLNAIALVVIITHFTKHRGKTSTVNLLPPAGFVIAATVLILFLHFLKGYYPFLFITAFLIIALLILLHKYIDWPILIALGGMSLIVQGIKPFFYGMIGAAVVILILGLLLKAKAPRWRQAILILFLAVAGFSVNLYIPIRSAQNPVLNENNPSSSLTTMINFLERKQYGSQSMTERMFKRRAEWTNQFGMHRRMGFWRFFHEQYGLKGPSSVFIILLGVFGFWELIRRRPKAGLPVLILFILCSVGLVLYMNFADGTRINPVTGQDYLEVRDRDYFFTPAFVFFGLAVGIGIATLIQMLRDSVAKFSAGTKKIILSSSLVLFLLPVYALANNYYYCDRSRNYIPYDYGWNLLDSAPKNAILFTGGDNDTFPLWCLQDVYNIRPDITLINLSLANTKWYIKQIVHDMNLNLGWTDADIDRLRGFRTKDGRKFRLQDQVIDAVVDHYYTKRPICFSVTVGKGSRKYKGQIIDSKLRMIGMVWKITETKSPLEVDVEQSLDFFLNPKRFAARGVNDPRIYQDEATLRLTRNYGNAFLVVADTLYRAGDYERALEVALSAVKRIPHAGDPVEFAARIYAKQGKIDELRQLINNTTSGDRTTLQVMMARAYRTVGDTEKAEQLLKSILQKHPTSQEAFNELLKLYYAAKRLNAMNQLLQLWVQFNPDDSRSREMLKELQGAIKAESSSVKVGGGK